jgi:hypothetical protein
MKKAMLVMSILVASSFLFSLIAVAPSISEQVTQPTGSTTTPMSKQQGTVQTSVAKQLPKEKFCDLEVDHCVLNGASVQGNYSSASPSPANCCAATVKVGQTANLICYYKVKTPPINSITEADVSAWGTGKSYRVDLVYPPNKSENKTLPQFTWEDVTHWKRAGHGTTPKIWSLSIWLTFTPEQADANHVRGFWFFVDAKNEIKEPNENNNGFAGFFKVTP